MNRSLLGVAQKQLVAVDLPDVSSHQHEFNGVNQLRMLLGQDTIKGGRLLWYRLHDSSDAVEAIEDTYSWYDARENIKNRSEFRLYYGSNDGLKDYSPGDSLFLVAITAPLAPILIGFVTESDSTWERQLRWLFNLKAPEAESFSSITADEIKHRSGDVESLTLIYELSLENLLPRPTTSDMELIIDRFSGAFPDTRSFSEFARSETGLPLNEPSDVLLLAWLTREEELFRALEGHLVGERLQTPFDSVDEFLSYSLSVQNRRKSRMGYALENHLLAIFNLNGIAYDYNQVTEPPSRPDFIFPSIAAYHDSVDGHGIHMLGAKSSCKDRWRQVLTEARQLTSKHLCTLEPGISQSQTSEMDRNGVILVIPESIQPSYDSIQREAILSISEFLALVS